MNSRKLGIGLAGLLALFAQATVNAGHWPGWRGDGSGVSAETGLPSEWSDERNVRWKARIDGDGISSPIVWGDRVFVTTAVEGEEQAVPPWASIGVAGLLLAVAVGTQIRPRAPAATAAIETDGPPAAPAASIVSRLDGLATFLALAVFVGGCAMGLLNPERLALKGALSRMWQASGVIGLAGLVAATGWTPMTSLARLVGASALAVAALLYHRFAPLNMYTEPMPLTHLLRVSGPMACAALWNIIVFAHARGVQRGVAGARPPGLTARRAAGAVSLAILAGGLFGILNFVHNQAGMLRCIVCLDRDSGKMLWQTAGFMAPAERKYYSNSYATPTPVTDGKFVVANFGPGLMCTDFNGKVLWTRMEPSYSEHLRYGAAISPVMFEDMVIHVYLAEWAGDSELAESRGYADESYIVALDKESGEEIWRHTPPGAHDCYGSPIIARSGPDPAILLTTWLNAVAVNPRNGERLWTCPIEIEQAVPSIVADEEHAYVLGGTHGPKAGVAIKIAARGNLGDEHITWRIKQGVPECASPILYDGLLYFITEKRVVTCVEPATGKPVWKHRLPYHCLGSPVAGDGKIYFVGEHGETVILKSGREFKELNRCSIGEDCLSSPALSDGKMFLRGKRHLFCIEERARPL